MWKGTGSGEDEGAILRALFRGFGIGLLETVPQLYLTTSLFGLAFEYSNNGMKAFQLMSLGLSALSIVKLVFSLLPPELFQQMREGTLHRCHYLMFFSFPSVAFTILSICAARVYHAYQCDSHLWNFTTGCVEVS
jgi:hypothetical protein